MNGIESLDRLIFLGFPTKTSGQAEFPAPPETPPLEAALSHNDARDSIADCQLGKHLGKQSTTTRSTSCS